MSKIIIEQEDDAIHLWTEGSMTHITALGMLRYATLQLEHDTASWIAKKASRLAKDEAPANEGARLSKEDELAMNEEGGA